MKVRMLLMMYYANENLKSTGDFFFLVTKENDVVSLEQKLLRKTENVENLSVFCL